ncbi:hypothetical protein Tco_1126087, partial [Tanacetum coccineum]
DKDDDVTLVDETQERQDDELITAGEAVTTASVEGSAAPTTIEKITLAQTLIQIKAAKPKVVTTAATTTTTTTRPKARGVVVQESNEDIQAKLDAELIEEQKLARLLAKRLQSKEREELTDEEKGKLFMELMEKRRKHFVLKGKSFDEIQKLFDKEMKRVNTFVAIGSEVQESKEKKVEGSEETAKSSRKKMLGRKRAEKEQQQES